MKLKYTDQKWAIAVASVILASIPGSAQAAVIYESFAPNTGIGTNLSGNPGGTGLTGNWSAHNHHDEAANLTYGSLSTSGGSVTTAGGWGTSSIAINTATPGYSALLADGGEMWFSMLVNPGTQGDQRFGFSIGNGALDSGNGVNTSQAIGFGWTPQELFYSKIWDDDAPTAWGGNNLQGAPGPNGSVTVNQSANALNTTYFVVGHVQWGATSTDNDTVTLYLPGTNLALGDAMATDFNVIADQSGFDTISTQILRTDAFYDEIRIGATAADVGVIPEPSTALLGGLGFLALLRRRR